jgi:hypothetical protein
MSEYYRKPGEKAGTHVGKEWSRKEMQIGKEKVKISLFVNDKGLKNSTRRFLELVNTFNKVAEYKVNIQKSVSFLYIQNKLSEKQSNSQIASEKEIPCA